MNAPPRAPKDPVEGDPSTRTQPQPITPDELRRRRRQFAKSKLRRDLTAEIDAGLHACVHCGLKDGYLTLDHIRPLLYGGLNERQNLQVLCRSCNSRKGVSMA